MFKKLVDGIDKGRLDSFPVYSLTTQKNNVKVRSDIDTSTNIT